MIEQETGGQTMKWTSWAFLAFLGALAFLVLFIADQQMNVGIDRLSTMRLRPQSALDADPNLKVISERSLYMRNEH
jgi:hypothetical protein